MSKNSSPSLLDSGQIIKRVFDDANDAIRVDATVEAVIGTVEVVIDANTGDSINSWVDDGSGNPITSTSTLTKRGLDVNVLNGIQTTPAGLSGGIKTQAILVTDVAVRLPPIAFSNRNSVSVRVTGNSTVYVGDSLVTADSGYPKRQNEEIVLDLTDNPSVELYGICLSGQSCEVRILETS